jgi:hypothetical protein
MELVPGTAVAAALARLPRLVPRIGCDAQPADLVRRAARIAFDHLSGHLADRRALAALALLALERRERPGGCDPSAPRALLRVGRWMACEARRLGVNGWRLVRSPGHLGLLLAHACAYLAGRSDDDHLTLFACRALMFLEQWIGEQRTVA